MSIPIPLPISLSLSHPRSLPSPVHVASLSPPPPSPLLMQPSTSLSRVQPGRVLGESTVAGGPPPPASPPAAAPPPPPSTLVLPAPSSFTSGSRSGMDGWRSASPSAPDLATGGAGWLGGASRSSGWNQGREKERDGGSTWSSSTLCAASVSFVAAAVVAPESEKRCVGGGRIVTRNAVRDRTGFRFIVSPLFLLISTVNTNPVP